MPKRLTVNDLINKSEKTLRRQLRDFVSEGGRYTAIALLSILPGLMYFQTISLKDLTQIFIGVSVLFFGLLSTIIVFFRNQTNQMRQDIVLLAHNHVKTVDVLTKDTDATVNKWIAKFDDACRKIDDLQVIIESQKFELNNLQTWFMVYKKTENVERKIKKVVKEAIRNERQRINKGR